MEKDWETEREELGKTRDIVKAECAEMQMTIKNM
jgi:hypothetical protein